jgi:hypothetical protein
MQPRRALLRSALVKEVAVNTGPDEEFDSFMRGRWPAMVRLGYALTGDAGHAEDLAQAAFARAYASWGRVRRAGDPDAYVRRIVINTHRSQFRRQRVAGLVSSDGVIAAGTVGDVRWQVAVHGPGKANPVPADTCTVVTLHGSPGGQFGPNCLDPSLTGRDTSAASPVVFSSGGSTETQGIGVSGPLYYFAGQASDQVTYLIVTFTDGQQLKLIPVSADGIRYFAWVAPTSMAVASVVAHLGSPYRDSGQTETAIPFNLPGQLPLFGRWQKPGQAAPPRASAVLARGTVGGHAWSVTAYEGPWGTCVTTNSGSTTTGECWNDRLDTTDIGTGWGGGAVVGSAAPGVALVKVTLSDKATVTARPVVIGNERMFAFWVSGNASPTSWTGYDASGHQVGSGAATSATASHPASP